MMNEICSLSWWCFGTTHPFLSSTWEIIIRSPVIRRQTSNLVDTLAPVYVPMIQQVVDGQLQIFGVGGWGADRLSPQQNLLQAIKRKQVAIVHAYCARAMGSFLGVRDDLRRPGDRQAGGSATARLNNDPGLRPRTPG